MRDDFHMRNIGRMNRRHLLVFGLAAVVAGPCFASGFQDEIVATLRAQGYDQITVEVTLLGRVKITAFKMSNQREIVINPRTGEILRDLWLTADGRVASSPPVFEDTGSGSGEDTPSGSGGSGSGDDTPSGSGSSGSGSSGSGSSGSDDKSDDDGPDDGSDRN